MLTILPPAFALIEAHRLADSQAGLRWLAALPPHCGVLIRRAERHTNTRQLRRFVRAARAGRRCVLIGGAWQLAWQAGAGAHFSEAALRRMGRVRPRQLASAAVHSRAALMRAQRLRVALVLVSPVFATPSHRGARPLGVLRFAAWAQQLQRRRLPRRGAPASHAPALYALGGMDARAWRRLSAARMAARTAGYVAQRAFAISRTPLCA
ncbi:MAG: thiamine phosphate synthase, partial [Hyphomicrobiales bacterium]|nr:thiamine phosphate synthase [Hyphomicrobiales bacterium]